MSHKLHTVRKYSNILILIVGIGFGLFFIYKTPSPSQIEQIAKAEFGGVSLRLEYATTTVARELGLGGRVNIPSDYGMLFVFQKDDYYGFWMKDTLVPLDLFWLDAQGQVVSIAEDVATSSYPHVFYPVAKSRYVLEMVAGFARAHSIVLGTPLLLKNFPTVSQ